MSAVDVWRTDVADAHLEVDGKCNVKQANVDACVLFGYPASGMKSINLSRLFQVGNAGMPCFKCSHLQMQPSANASAECCQLL